MFTVRAFLDRKVSHDVHGALNVNCLESDSLGVTPKKEIPGDVIHREGLGAAFSVDVCHRRCIVCGQQYRLVLDKMSEFGQS